MDLQTFGHKMEGLCIDWDAVSDRVKSYCNQCVLPWHSAMLETERKNCLGSFLLVFSFGLSCLFLGIRCTYFFSCVCLIEMHLSLR